MEVESPEHTRDFAEVDINNGAAGSGSEDEEEEVPAPGSVTLDRNESDLFVSALSPSSIGDVHVSGVSGPNDPGSSPHWGLSIKLAPISGRRLLYQRSLCLALQLRHEWRPPAKLVAP